MITVIRCGTLVDGSGKDPVCDATLLIEGDTIAAVNPSGPLPREASILDASALTVMPGLIDCHVHLLGSPQSLQQDLLTPYSLAVCQALEHARLTLEAGFTSARDAGGTPLGVKLAIDRGLFPGPRLRIAVAALSQTGGHGDATMPNGADLRVGDPEHPTTVVDGVEEVRRATRELLRAGADQIKVHASGGVMSPSDEPTAPGFSPDELAVAVYEAQAAGKYVLAHAHGARGIRNAVAAGVASIEHGTYLEEETAVEMKARGTYLVPTLVAPLWIIRRAEEDPTSIPPYGLRKAKESVAAHSASFRMALERGVKIALGTDSAVGPHGANADELQQMVKCGMSSMQAIVAATRSAAECTRIDHLTGTLEPGKRADLLAVDGDPLADIAVLREKDRLRLIMKDGSAFKNTLG